MAGNRPGKDWEYRAKIGDTSSYLAKYDVSYEKCAPFGFFHGQRVWNSFGRTYATVVGVAADENGTDRIHFQRDGADGGIYLLKSASNYDHIRKNGSLLDVDPVANPVVEAQKAELGAELASEKIAKLGALRELAQEKKKRQAAEKIVNDAAAKEARKVAAAQAKDRAAERQLEARQQATADRTARLSEGVLASTLHHVILANQEGAGSEVILDGSLSVAEGREVRFPRLLAERRLPSLLKPSAGVNLQREAALFVVARVLSGTSVSKRGDGGTDGEDGGSDVVADGPLSPNDLVGVLAASIELSAPEWFMRQLLDEAIAAAADPSVVVPLLASLSAADEAGLKPFAPSNAPAVNAPVFFQKGARMAKAALSCPWHAVLSWASNSASSHIAFLSLEDRKEAVANETVLSVLGSHKPLPDHLFTVAAEDVSKAVSLLRGAEPDFWINFPGTDYEPVGVHRFVCAATGDTHFARLALAVQFSEGSTNLVDAELPEGVPFSAFQRIVHSMYDPVAAADGLYDHDVGDAMGILHLVEYWMGLTLASLQPQAPQRKSRRTGKRSTGGKAEVENTDSLPTSGCFLTLATRAQEVVDMGVTAENCVSVWKAAEALGDTDLVASALKVVQANVDGPAAAALLELVLPQAQPEASAASKKRSGTTAKVASRKGTASKRARR